MSIPDDYTMPFGKHKDEKIANVPASYLLWLYDNNKCYADVKQYIKENEEILRKEVEPKN